MSAECKLRLSFSHPIIIFVAGSITTATKTFRFQSGLSASDGSGVVRFMSAKMLDLGFLPFSNRQGHFSQPTHLTVIVGDNILYSEIIACIVMNSSQFCRVDTLVFLVKMNKVSLVTAENSDSTDSKTWIQSQLKSLNINNHSPKKKWFCVGREPLVGDKGDEYRREVCIL